MSSCLWCGQPTANPKYCSRSCAARHTNIVYRKRRRRARDCKHCGTEVAGRRTVCGQCHPHSVDWSSITIAEMIEKRRYQKHSRLRNLARQAYLSAGRPQRCAVCGYDRHFEVCHVRAMRDFPASAFVSTVNRQDNLIALCPNHHWELDNGLLDLSSLGFPEFDHSHP